MHRRYKRLIVTREFGLVEKGWGSENIFVSNDYYCGKFLNFNKDAMFSMHFHKDKIETWFVLSGEFYVDLINTTDASVQRILLKPGMTWTNEVMVPHRVICVEEGTLLEISTPDSVEDNYRVFPGDSQKNAE